jgi:diguanylate cyclase (GGDEF)-like protein
MLHAPAPVAIDGVPTDASAVGPADVADDTLVFARIDDRFVLTGGVGRGAGWADIVEVLDGQEPLVDRAWVSGSTIRIRREAPVRVIGPYWSSRAAIVPVGQEHLVVFGGLELDVPDAVLVCAAASAIAQTHGPSAEKLLADELELVHALRDLMAYRPETVADTARHIARVAARSLACDLGAIRVLRDGEPVMEFVSDDPDQPQGGSLAGVDAAGDLDAACAMTEPLLEQTVEETPRIWTGAVVSGLTLPLRGRSPLGALSLAHGSARPRGFTMLCQRIARAIAESAELLLTQAEAREQLYRERDLLRRLSMTDPLTGLGNRTAWDAAVKLAASSQRADGAAFVVVSLDLDGLKGINDRYGHGVGDTVIRGAANLLRASVRSGDVARSGGDEFLILLAGDERTAERIVRRVRRNENAWRVSEHGIAPALSIGWALAGDDLETALARADERMYASKRRRTRQRMRTLLTT